MGAKGSVEAAKMNPDSWGHLERGSRHYNHRHNQRSQSLNRGQALSRADVTGGQLGCASCAMGNKLSCSCAPLMRKAYRYEDSPWQTSRRRDGHLLRLWAEVFHVSASGAGTVKWQQVSEDLVPVNITCIQDSPECVFHITAYNSQVDKILDVRLVQPGTRIGQASECFVYWKDPMTNDTWGLNFTSPIDAKQFRECCSPSFKFSRKASSSYSLKLDPPGKSKVKAKRKPLSTPASPSRAREPQCTCMSTEQYARLRAQDPRYRGSSTLPRATNRATETELGRGDKVVSATSSTSLYDNVASNGQQDNMRQTKSQETNTMTISTSVSTQNHVGSQVGQQDSGIQLNQGHEETSKSEGTQAGGTLQQSGNPKTMSQGTGTRSKDYMEEMGHDMHLLSNSRRSKSKSTEDMNVDPVSLKRMLKPMTSTESPVTSPEMGRKRYSYYNNATTMPHTHQHAMHTAHVMNPNMMAGSNTMRGLPPHSQSRFSNSRSSHEIGRGGFAAHQQQMAHQQQQRGLYLELEQRERNCMDGSPPSDNVIFDNQCYATTPSSSNGNSDQDQPYGSRSMNRHGHHHQNQPNVTPTPGSPTSRLLLEYEMHLRNTLAKGMDAESYSLHTFEALLSQSMENLELAESLPGSTQRSPYPTRRRTGSAKSSTLPLPHGRPVQLRERERDRERDGYYSDRNELMRERERDRDRDRGYLSDHNSRCASCIGESARAQWFRHSDGWRSGSSTLGSGSGQGMLTSQSSSGHKRSPWDSLPSLRQDNSMNDSGYKSARGDSLEQQRGVFDRQDSFRSDYLSDRESRYGIVQQASIDSTDSRLCYLTSSEITPANQQNKLNEANKISGNDYSSSTEKTLLSGNANRKAICICNAQYRWQQELLLKKAQLQQQGEQSEKKEKRVQDQKQQQHLTGDKQNEQSPLLLSKKHGSLDRLLQMTNIDNLATEASTSPIISRKVKGHEKLIRKIKSTESALPSSSANQLPVSSDNMNLDQFHQYKQHSMKHDDIKMKKMGTKQEMATQLQHQQQIHYTRHYVTPGTREGKSEPIQKQSSSHHRQHHHASQQQSSVPSDPQKFYKSQSSRQLIRPPSESEGGKSDKKQIAWSNQVHHKPSESVAQQFQSVQKLATSASNQQQFGVKLTGSKAVCSGSTGTTKFTKEPFLIDNTVQSIEWFDRSHRQRHSSRSAGDAENAIYQSTPEQRGGQQWIGGEKYSHQRHSSGPSELSLLKEDIAKLLSQLPLTSDSSKSGKPFEQQRGKSVEFVKDDSTINAYNKRPVQRQTSGPCDITALRKDLIEFLTRQPVKSQPQPVNKEDLYAKIVKPKQEKQSNAPIPKPRKRHSMTLVDEAENTSTTTRKVPMPRTTMQTFEIPKDMLAKLQLKSSYVDLAPRPSLGSISNEFGGGKTLRHSASEVVTPGSDQMLSQMGRVSMQQQTTADCKRTKHVSRSEKSGQKTRRNYTQRSATVSEIVVSETCRQKCREQKQALERRSSSSISSIPRCTDPNCPFLPVCTDPDCCYLANCYDRIRYSQHVPRCRCKKCTPKCSDYRCYSLPRCMDSKCAIQSQTNLIKCNSLPRCAESSSTFIHKNYLQENFQDFPLVPQNNVNGRSYNHTNGSRASLPRESGHKSRKGGGGNGVKSSNGNNNKLIKSVSAASLNSRRRRHKTVHFGENLLREVCQNRKLIKPLQKSSIETIPSGGSSAPLQPNIQMLYNFIEGVLSSWVDDDYDDIMEDGGHALRSGADSEPERGAAVKPLYRCNRARIQTIKRVVGEAAQLKGSSKLGNQRYRHRHWRGTAKDCNERFLRKISDDDRMSLTTAVSDEEDGESIMASPYKAKATGTAAASFNCTGAVRKAGFLSVKKWLLRKKHQIELARKRGWKGYWVCLKGTTLLFYPCDSREGRSVEAAPKHLIIVDGAIMQPIPEHPKRDYIFCLSTAFGDAYLFQAPCQVELENWVNSIHSACAAAFARHRGKTGTLHLLQEEIFRLEKSIESDHKLKHMAELQQSVVTDQESRHQIQAQILQWEENLERLHCEQFRLRCYMASLQSGELPNPKSLLTHVSRPTKNTLNKLGVFTVSSFHAFICARSPSLLNNLLAGRGATKRRPPVLSRSNSGSSRRSMQMGGGSREESEKTYKISLPDNNHTTVFLRDAMSVEEFLASACARKNLNPMEHFVRVKKRRDMEDHNYFVPHRNDLIETYLHTHEMVEVCAKILYQVELQRTTLEHMWGFSVEAELIENADRQDELCCYVSRVEEKSVAMQNGIIKSDEIMVINGAIVSDLDMMYLESVLQEEQALCMMMRSSRVEPPELAGILRVTDDMIDSLVCPPPPSDPPIISEEMISGLIVPAPGWKTESQGQSDSHLTTHHGQKQTSRNNSFEIENLLKTAEQITGFCRSPQETRKSSPTGSLASSVVAGLSSRQLSDVEKLRKVILELVDTERTYVKHLNNLLEYYLEPLKRETFLSNAEIATLFGNIQEIVTFQRQFLQNLEEALELEPDFHKFDQTSQFKNVLFSIGSAFLYYVNHFKLYSSFCASHSKAQKVLHPNEGNQALQEFLAARNPKQQHSSTLESYLIKPIQRILKYPLLLQQLKNLSDPHAEEHHHLIEALKGMEKVAEHINEMQRIHEEYGAIFDHLFRQHQKSCKQPIDLSPGDLLYYGGVEWLNISDFLGKIKKGLELHAMCFVFKSAVVFLCKERLRQKKKLMGVSSKNTPNEVEIIRYQVLIPVTEVQVRASSAKDMDSHFLWELIHLRSQLQRRSEKVYVLSNSTADFRNAFLKTIRQIIRESVRNMSIPMKGLGSLNSMTSISAHTGGNSQTLERPKPTVTIIQGSQTLGKTKKSKTGQRHSAGNIDYDNLVGSTECDEGFHHPTQTSTFRTRSKTVGDSSEPPLPPKRTTSEMDRSDPGTKSEGEDDSQQGVITTINVNNASTGNKLAAKATLGRTPNHLTLSTTSTLSVGSTGSQARLIQSSHPPSSYHPVLMKDLGSPVWKPRDMINLGDQPSTARKDDAK